MAVYLAGEYLAPSDMFDKCLKAVDAMFAAANSIPEGPQRHELKVWPEYYAAIDAGKKTLELRKDDRGFQVGDSLLLREFDPKTGIYGESCERVVTHIVQGGHFGIADGYVAMSISEAIVPEGAPVGTIARRPDGFWIAHMTESGWEYTELVTGTWRGSDADSWPVIYDPNRRELRDLWNRGKATEADREEADLTAQPYNPDEYHEGDKPRLERLMRDAATRLAESSTEEKDNYHLVNDLLDAAKRLDPTAQQEREAFNRFPGIENPTTADYIGAAVADEQLKLVFALRDVRKERGMEIADVAEAADVLASEISMFESGSSNPTLSLIRRYAKAVEAVFTADVRKWEDTQARQEPQVEGNLSEIPKSSTQQEPAYTVAAASEEMAKHWDNSIVTTTKREPRVVDRLGVDEQGSRWRNWADTEFWFQDECWNSRTRDGETSSFGSGYEPRVGIFTEVLS
ncbi:hypothetical protein E3G54_004451 [Mycobacteroides abscessus]|nr:hypothetical protein [Mycobacteroides abscessus]